jgi:hypothetical protein
MLHFPCKPPQNKKHHMTTHHYRHLGHVVAAKLFVVAISVVMATVAGSLPTRAEDAIAEVKTSGDVIIATNNPEELQEALEEKNLEVTDEVELTPNKSYIAVDATSSDSRIKTIQNEENDIISAVKPNYRYKIAITPNDSYYPAQWNLPKIGAPAVWDMPMAGQPSVVAVIDSGVLSTQQWPGSGPFAHPDFPDSKFWKNQAELGAAGSEGAVPNCTSRSLPLEKWCNNLDDDGNGYVDDYRGWDFMGGYFDTDTCPNYLDALRIPLAAGNYATEDNDPGPYSCDDPYFPTAVNMDQYDSQYCGYGYGPCSLSHGTSVASIIGAASNNGTGIAGVDWNAQIMNLRIFDAMGTADTLDVANAIDYAIDNGADVINLSLAMAGPSGCGTVDTVIESLLAEAYANDIVTVAASGNEGTGTVCYPARSPYAIAVGASTSTDARAGFSSYGPELDLVAPGYGVPAANAPHAMVPGEVDPAVYGTSFAAPHAAGAAAILKSMYPEANAGTIRDKLRYSADKAAAMNGSQFTNTFGYGRLNLLRAVQPGAETPPPAPKNTLKPGEVLKSGGTLRSSRGHRLVLQKDGNLVLYSARGKALWHTRTYGKGGYRLVLQKDGNLVLYTSKNKALWNTRTYRKSVSNLAIQSDGNLVLYSTSKRSLWASNTYGK